MKIRNANASDHESYERVKKNVLLSKDISDPKAVSWCFVHVLAQVRLEAVV